MELTVIPGGKSSAVEEEEASVSSSTGRSALKNGMGKCRRLLCASF
jgi:hypothetical protein